jgi:hypothetical protein
LIEIPIGIEIENLKIKDAKINVSLLGENEKLEKCLTQFQKNFEIFLKNPIDLPEEKEIISKKRKAYDEMEENDNEHIKKKKINNGEEKEINYLEKKKNLPFKEIEIENLEIKIIYNKKESLLLNIGNLNFKDYINVKIFFYF